MTAPDVLRSIEVVNVGLPAFADAVRAQGVPVVDVEWRPPAGGDPAVIAALERLWGEHGEAVGRANAEAVAAIEACAPRAVGVERAGGVVPLLAGRALLHAGPPIAWGRMCEPQRRALAAACVFEGWADDREAARSMLAAGEVALAPGNEHDHVGPMTGVCSPSMPVWVVEDEAAGRRVFATLNEGPGATLWFGVGDDEAVDRLRFFRDELGPRLARALELTGPVDVLGLAQQALQMGDELHMRSQAAGLLLMRELLAAFAVVGGERPARFLAGNHLFFLNLTMAACKCASLAASGIRGSSVVSLMSRNGVETGIQLAGLPGRWFTAPAPPVADALLRDGYEPDEGALDIGDSAVIECCGIGAMAVAAAPAVAAFFGGDARAAIARSELMGQICTARSQRFAIPALDFAGSPLGIDARLVTELGITPQISTGVLDEAGLGGQIGAGIAHQPVEPFRAATLALVEELDGGSDA